MFNSRVLGKMSRVIYSVTVVLAWNFKKLQTLHTDRLISNEKKAAACGARARAQIPQ